MARARQAHREGSVDAFLDDVDSRISSRVLRMALFSAARDIMGADGGIDANEDRVLAGIAARFS